MADLAGSVSEDERDTGGIRGPSEGVKGCVEDRSDEWGVGGQESTRLRASPTRSITEQGEMNVEGKWEGVECPQSERREKSVRGAGGGRRGRVRF